MQVLHTAASFPFSISGDGPQPPMVRPSAGPQRPVSNATTAAAAEGS